LSARADARLVATTTPGGESSLPPWPALAAAGAALGLLLVASALFAALFMLAGLPSQGQTEVACAASGEASRGIPPAYLQLYRDAGRSYGLDWSILAAIGSIESGHGLNVGPSSAGALGPMQFLAGTWSRYGTDGNGDGRKDIMDPADAIPGAARLLKANGAPGDWERAVFAYNHADWYVREVLAQAEQYRGSCPALYGTVALGEGALAWPVQGPITSQFCARRPWERCHPGIDIAVPTDTRVRAAAAGTVALAKPVSGYGNFLCVDHAQRLATCYAHLAEYRTATGARVRRGEVIALSDCTGRCFGPHLHFEVRLGDGIYGRPVDPVPYLAGGR
jgi:peptidoglycan LD-endopeptidase LytH